MRASRIVGWSLLILLAAACQRDAAGLLQACAGAKTTDEAISACKAVLESKSATPKELAHAHMYLGTALNGAGKPAEGLRELEQAVRMLPKDPILVAQLGAIRSMQGDDEGARRDLDQALRLDPRNAVALGNLAILHERRGEHPEALALLDRAIAADPTLYQGYAERCWIRAVVGKDLAATMPDCEKAIEMAPGDANNFNNRGFVHFRMGEYAKSIADYDRSIAGNPQVASSWMMRGLAKRAAGVEGAQADIDKGKSMDPGVAARYAGYGIDTD